MASALTKSLAEKPMDKLANDLPGATEMVAIPE